jgi:hypothetical protein
MDSLGGVDVQQEVTSSSGGRGSVAKLGTAELWGEAAALVRAGTEVDGEGDFAVGVQIPASAVKVVGVGVGERDAFPAEARALPAKAVGVDGENVVKAGEEDDAGGGCREDLGGGAEGQVEAVPGGERVDEIGVAAGEGEEVVGARAGEDSGGKRRVAKA